MNTFFMQYPIPEEFFLRGFYTSFLFFLGFNLYFFNHRKTACKRVYAFTLFLSALTMVISSSLSMVYGSKAEFSEHLQTLCYVPLVPAFGVLLVSLIWGESRRSRLWAIFLLMDLPFLLFIIAYLYTRADILLPVSIISSGIYGYTMYVFAILRVRKYRRMLLNSYSNTEHLDLDWSRPFLVALPILLALFLLFGVGWTNFFGGIGDIFYCFSAMIILSWLAKFIVNQEQVDMNLLLSTEEEAQPEGKAQLEPSPTPTYTFVDRLKKDFEEKQLYLRANLTIKEVAAITGCHIAELSAYLNNVLGKNFNQYVNELRIEHACSLMRDTTMEIEELAQVSGFVNKATFWRVFQVMRGITPDQYQQQLLSSSPAAVAEPVAIVPEAKKETQPLAEPRYDVYTNFIVLHPTFRQLIDERYPDLTPREYELCLLVAMGKNMAETAQQLGVSEASLRVFRSRLRSKMHLARNESLESVLSMLAAETS